MGYKALYRTYRPQKFDEVAGQKQIIQTLKNAINENKIAHAYLFTGPRGTGKTTMAKLLAKALNCLDNEKRPCDECENCKAISEGSFPDVIEIDAASNNGVDEVRSLIDKVKYAPINGKYKVYIIDEVHMMSQGAFNALLKTLEEPPTHVIFILATTEPHKVLPTILSRCQRFDFGRIATSDIKKRVMSVLDCEDILYDDEAIELVCELCDGGMRDALSILDQTIAYAGNEISAQDIRDIYGIVSNLDKIDFIKKVILNDHKVLLERVNEYDERGIDLVRLTNNLIDLLKEVIIYKSSKSIKGLKVINESTALGLVDVSNKKLFSMIDVLVEALSSYRRAGSAKVLFEIACLKMCELTDNVEEKVVYKEVVKEIAKEISLEEKKVENKSEEIVETRKESVVPVVENIVNVETKNEDLLEKNNVSCGTNVKDDQETLKNEGAASEEELLNVLVQASKDALVKAKQQWVMLPKYFNSPTTAKVTSILLDGYPLAACDKAIIIGYNNDVYLNRVYSQNNYDEMNSFLKALYNDDVKCYCLTTQDFLSLKEKYVALRQLGKLPKPVPIVIQRRNIRVEDDANTEVDEGIEYAKKLFGDNVIIKEEE